MKSLQSGFTTCGPSLGTGCLRSDERVLIGGSDPSTRSLAQVIRCCGPVVTIVRGALSFEDPPSSREADRLVDTILIPLRVAASANVLTGLVT